MANRYEIAQEVIVEILDIVPLEVGEEFIYTPNGSHVYISRIYKKNRWEYADFHFVDGDELFASEELTHWIIGPNAEKYQHWKRLRDE